MWVVREIITKIIGNKENNKEMTSPMTSVWGGVWTCDQERIDEVMDLESGRKGWARPI